MCQADDFAHRQHGAQRIRHVGAGNDARAVTQLRSHAGHVDDAASVHGNDLDHRAVLLRCELPRNDVGVMLERGEQDFIAGLQSRPRIGLRHQVDGLGGAAREDDLACRRRIHEGADSFARAFEQPGGFLAELVHAPMHIGVVHPFVFVHRGDHARRALR
jgi:hypothetical protein